MEIRKQKGNILYVNGEYRGDSALGKLMHDFKCINADDMNFELMANRTPTLATPVTTLV
ncbi:MAG: hypothetical protein HFH23_18365 [Ruminococcus sp.]|nr:hypothetical protein [Ruminococcus sp.]